MPVPTGPSGVNDVDGSRSVSRVSCNDPCWHRIPGRSFVASRFLRPTPSAHDNNKLRSILLPGYETDQSLYVRRESTYECGADPVGDAHINFHFQYYWYAIIFLVFDIAFMFLAFGGVIAIQDAGADIDIWSAMLTLTVFIVLMSLGVWHVFRKRGRIYI